MHFPARTSWHASRPLPLVLRLADCLRARLRQLVLVRPQAPRDAPAPGLNAGAELLRVLLARGADLLHPLAEGVALLLARGRKVRLVLLQALDDAPLPRLDPLAEPLRILLAGMFRRPDRE